MDWLMLARSYTELQRYADAVRAYEQLVKLVPNERKSGPIMPMQ